MTDQPRVGGYALRVVLGLLPIVSAAVVVYLAAVLDWLACENDSSPTCDRQGLAHAQYVIAWIGVVPAVALAISLVRGKRQAVRATLTVFLLTYATWIVLVDAAEHGWDDLTIVPFAAIRCVMGIN